MVGQQILAAGLKDVFSIGLTPFRRARPLGQNFVDALGQIGEIRPHAT